MSTVMIVYLILIILLNISLIVFYLTHLRQINPYLKFGILFTVLLMVMDASYLLAVWGTMKKVSFTGVITASIINYIKTTIYAGLGIFCCSQLNIKEIPLVRRLLRNETEETIDFERYIADIAFVTLAFVIYSVTLLKMTSPGVSGIIKSSFSQETKVNLATILFVISFAYTEEIFFRLAAQNFLAHVFKLEEGRYWIAIFITAGIWTLAHSGTLDPEWVKYVQVFPMGIALGYFYKKHGVEFCILTHMLTNIVMAFMGNIVFM